MPTAGKEHNRDDELALHFSAEYPNFPEVSGTSLPLVSTVLAGFAVSIIVQVTVRPQVTDNLPGRVSIALVAFMLATLRFLSSTVFAVNAQAHNYLPFLDTEGRASQRLGIADHDQWIRNLERRWRCSTPVFCCS